MALIDINFHSMTLGKHHTFKVILPETTEMFKCDSLQPLPTLLLLHGLSSDDSMFSRYTNVEMYANKHNLAIIMPNADHSFYTNMKHGHSYFDHIKEVWTYAHCILPLSVKQCDNYIAGNSMGGFGAFYFAYNNPQLFSKVIPMSGAIGIDDHFLNIDWYDFDVEAIIGDTNTIKKTELDSEYIIDQTLKDHIKEDLPKLLVMCGTEDNLYEANLRFLDLLKQRGIQAEYSFKPGIHNWTYWDQSIREAIDWIFKDKEVDTSIQIMNWVG